MKRGRVEEQLERSGQSWSITVSALRKQTHLESERLSPQGELQVHTTRVGEKVWLLWCSIQEDTTSLFLYITSHPLRIKHLYS